LEELVKTFGEAGLKIKELEDLRIRQGLARRAMSKAKAQEVAKGLNLKFEGWQEGVGWMFTDMQHGGITFCANTPRGVKKGLAGKWKEFGISER